MCPKPNNVVTRTLKREKVCVRTADLWLLSHSQTRRTLIQVKLFSITIRQLTFFDHNFDAIIQRTPR